MMYNMEPKNEKELWIFHEVNKKLPSASNIESEFV